MARRLRRPILRIGLQAVTRELLRIAIPVATAAKIALRCFLAAVEKHCYLSKIRHPCTVATYHRMHR